MNATVSVNRAIWTGILGVTWSSIIVLAGGLGVVVMLGRQSGLTGWPALVAFVLPFVISWGWWHVASSGWWAWALSRVEDRDEFVRQAAASRLGSPPDRLYHPGAPAP